MLALGIPPQAIDSGGGSGLPLVLGLAALGALLWLQFRGARPERWRARGRALLPVVRHVAWDIQETVQATRHPFLYQRRRKAYVDRLAFEDIVKDLIPETEQ